MDIMVLHVSWGFMVLYDFSWEHIHSLQQIPEFTDELNAHNKYCCIFSDLNFDQALGHDHFLSRLSVMGDGLVIVVLLQAAPGSPRAFIMM
jgi:hypothetical protein